ncbi:hypothetical protein HYX03_04170 [Candidatus Woesearchaeota archaeon]|nr:hypothetical protein [Candidatus Woesearchaeota archaeon]
MRERKKATDVFRESDYLFSKKTPFEQAFSEIKSVIVDVEETGYGINQWNHKSRYTEKTLGEFINCQNPICYNGGFSVGSILREMIKNKQTTISGKYEGCQGYEGSPKGKRRYRSCINHFKVSVQINYNEEIEKIAN